MAVVARLERCARFLHHGGGIGGRAAQRGEPPTGRMRFPALRLLARIRNERGRVGQYLLGLAAGFGCRLRGSPCRDQCLLAAVERAAESQSVVALIDGCATTRQRLFSGDEFLVSVPLRAGPARGIDGRLRLLYFSVGRIETAGADNNRQGTHHSEPADTMHPFEYTTVNPAGWAVVA